MRSLGSLSIFVLLAACHADAPSTEPQDPAGPPAQAAATPTDCAALEPATAADEAFERGSSTLAEAYDGEHYLQAPFEAAMTALREAAEQGHRGAQSVYGRTLFSVRFTNQAPVPEEEADYVAAFMFLRIAALRGDAEAQGFLPGLTNAEPAFEETPIDSVPAPWLKDAYARADAWMACHGESVGDRGAQ